MEEKALFERYGWSHDVVQRCWISPLDPEIAITTDVLAENASPEFESHLRMVVMKYGRLPKEDRA